MARTSAARTVPLSEHEALRKDSEALRLQLAEANARVSALTVEVGRLADLVADTKAVLREAIEQGGTTLRDFVGSDGKPGYFRMSLNVYDRAGEPCAHCGKPIRRIVSGQRATYYCPGCQR